MLAQSLHGVDWLGMLPLALLLACVFLPISRWRLIMALLASELLFLGLIALSGREATLLAAQSSSTLARTSFGSGLWSLAALMLLVAADALSRLTPNVFWRTLGNAQIWLLLVLILLSGQLDNLALLREYANRREVFDAALLRHLQLLFGTLFPALIIGVPLGLWCYRHGRRQSGVFALLNIIQTVPSVALFGLLMAPLAGVAKAFPALARIGINGIGLAPALIALVLYALLPLVRSVVAGLQQVPREVLESARGMGMTRRQIFLQVEVPLALPVLLTGLRVVAVQTVGMATIAALIGAGGFGSIIFQGLLSSALELVLLGVIPVIALAVIVDTFFKFTLSLMERERG